MTEQFDINAVASGLLRDLATIQTSKAKMFGYKRAAAAVQDLERPLSEFEWHDDALLTIHGIGPASARIIREVLETGGSSIVERAVDEAGQTDLIRTRRRLRERFLSRAAVVAACEDPSLTGVSLTDQRGEFHMHSEWSDGVPTLEDLVSACQARGYAYAAVTDHSYGLRVAHGMSMTDAEEQHGHIDRLNRANGSTFTLLKGVEANIGPEGDLDLSDEEARRFEIVLAAPHSKLRIQDDQTRRMTTAIANPHVRVLAHPRGRIRETRQGIVADWDRVFGEAAASGVAIELDGDPARQDLDYELAARARRAGCIFSLSSDAHTVDQLVYAETAFAHARLAGITPAEVVNCWDRDQILRWVADRSTAVASHGVHAR